MGCVVCGFAVGCVFCRFAVGDLVCGFAVGYVVCGFAVGCLFCGFAAGCVFCVFAGLQPCSFPRRTCRDRGALKVMMRVFLEGRASAAAAPP